MYDVTVVIKVDAPAMGISVLKMLETRILAPDFERQEDESDKPVYRKGLIKVKVLTVDQD